MSEAIWSLYFIRNNLGQIYTGITTDVARRFKQHSQGQGAKALKGKGPLTLVNAIEVGDRSLASKLEYRFKQLNKAEKEKICQSSVKLGQWREMEKAQLFTD